MCGTGFNQAAAQVVCRNLNLTGGTPRYGAVYGKGKVPILLSNLRCRGRESELSACLGTRAGIPPGGGFIHSFSTQTGRLLLEGGPLWPGQPGPPFPPGRMFGVGGVRPAIGGP